MLSACHIDPWRRLSFWFLLCILNFCFWRTHAFLTQSTVSTTRIRSHSSRFQSSSSSRAASSSNNRKRKGKKVSFLSPKSKETQTWRVFNVEVHPDELQLDLHRERNIKNQKDRQALQEQFLHPSVLDSLCQRLGTSPSDLSGRTNSNGINLRVVRRSLDARAKKQRQDGRSGPRFVYVLDIDVPPTSSLRLRHQPGKCECLGATTANLAQAAAVESSAEEPVMKPKRIIVVGAGPAGLFCALRLAREPGITPILLERGQAVEVRGKDIGALTHRKLLQPESNYAFGEGE